MRTGFEGMVCLGMKRNSWQRPQCVSLQSCENHGASGKDASRSSSRLALCFLGPALSGAPLSLPLHTVSLISHPPSMFEFSQASHSDLLSFRFTFPFTHLLLHTDGESESSISLVRIRINCGLVRMQSLQVCVKKT